MPVRTRFAPSPTGHLHIGGARTALFNWLFARNQGGQFLLRIEDTDRERSDDTFTRDILEGLRWLGIDWDEEPVHQSHRFAVYAERVQDLLDAGSAYRCYCPPEELARKRDEAMKAGRKPRYDRTCRERTDAPDRPFCVRFKSPRDGVTRVTDLVKGEVRFDNTELDDLIIQRTDGTPTYNFVVVVDDSDMAVTHIIRGDDHLNNTPRQVLLYEALGLTPPQFAHLPLILGDDKKRLSKRHGASALLAYRDMGYHPEALMNFLARIGWSHGDQEEFTREELIQLFSPEGIGSSAGVFNASKLDWLNQQYMKRLPPEVIAERLVPFLHEHGAPPPGDAPLARIVVHFQERATTLVEMARLAAFLFHDDHGFEYDPTAQKKFLTSEAATHLAALRLRLADVTNWTTEEIAKVFAAYLDDAGVKLGAIAQPVRVALTGGTVSPGIYDTVFEVGKDRTLARLDRAIAVAEDEAQGAQSS